MLQFLTEIHIHRSLDHQHVVRYHGVGSNPENYYVLLEKCNNKSLRQVVKARARLPEEEVRYWMSQLLDGLSYLHANYICHRDLKLDNVFLHNMQVKLGDFGFSVKLLPEEKTRTFCGTPNYIAPEVVARTPYSLPVDIWAFGVLIYTMLFGTPPFETAAADTTYAKIAANDYTFPTHTIVSEEAKDVIRRCLQHSPSDRPTAQELQKHDFFTSLPIPSTLHPSALGYHDHQFGVITGSAKKRARDTMVPTPIDTMAAPIAKRLTTEYNKENTGNVARSRAKTAAAIASSPHHMPNGENTGVEHHNGRMQESEVQPSPHRRQTPNPKRAASAASTTMKTPSRFPTSGANTTTTTANTTMANSSASNTTTHGSSSTKPHVMQSHITSTPWNHQRHEATIRRIVDRLNEIASTPAATAVPTTPPPSVTPHEAHQLGHHWIVKWVDYSQRFGLGYQYCNDSVGVLFTDKTSLLTKTDSVTVSYTKFVESPHPAPSVVNASSSNTKNSPVADSTSKRQLNYVVEKFDRFADASSIQLREQLRNRLKLLEYFTDYMKTKLIASSGLAMVCESHSSEAASENHTHKPSSPSAAHAPRSPATSTSPPSDGPPMGVFKWVKTTSAIGFLFTNYTVQINFYDHVKLVITLQDPQENQEPVELITVVNDKGTSVTRTAKQLMAGGVMTSALIQKLQFAASVISTEFIAHP